VTEPVVVETVSTETEAEMLCALLRTAEIKCGHRESGNTAEGFLGGHDVLVAEEDVERAREVLATQPSEE
jgi:Putative prokaryotic signal transducing protein